MHRFTIIGLLCLSSLGWAAADFTYVRSAAAPEVLDAVVIDTRSLTECRQASAKGARCLPAEDFLARNGQLPHERDLLWLLGTAGLNGSENVLITGTTADARDFVAGLLYLAGQKSVRVLDAQPLIDAGPGRERGMIRSAVWTAPLRDHLWVLGKDILQDKAVLADARNPVPPAPQAIVVAANTAGALARFTQWRAGQGYDVRVFPAPLRTDLAQTRR
jgi:hypothetical protein